jgi:hypothetical protein
MSVAMALIGAVMMLTALDGMLLVRRYQSGQAPTLFLVVFLIGMNLARIGLHWF